jgi:ribosomal protein S9
MKACIVMYSQALITPMCSLFLRCAQAALRQPKLDSTGRAYGTGRRKTSVARVWIKPGTGIFLVNKSPLHERFTRDKDQDDILDPMFHTGYLTKVDVDAYVKGGGNSGQAGAVRHGLARALDNFQVSLFLFVCVLVTVTLQRSVQVCTDAVAVRHCR